MIRPLTLVIALSGCAATPTIKQSISPEGRPYTLVLDAQDNPCRNRGWNVGCYAAMSDGTHRVYTSSIAPWHVIRHESAHVDGMRHSDWDPRSCAVVTVAAEGYPLGSTICITSTGEHVK